MFKVELPKEPTRIWDLNVPIVKVDNNYHVYLTTEILEVAVYDELCFLLGQATKKDTFHMHISTPGGDLNSFIAIYNAMKKSAATIIGYLTGSVASAGTMITMGCDQLEVDDFTMFMCHNYSTQTSGKGSEIKVQQEFMEKLIANIMTTVYADFMTTEEIERLLEDKDYWFDKDDILERWSRKKAN